MKLNADRVHQIKKARRVFLYDHFALVRFSIAHWIGAAPDLAVCGESDHPGLALKAIRRLKPDILVSEVISQRDIEFIEAVRRRNPRLPILVFSSGEEMLQAPRALLAGADGYLVKGTDAAGLVEGIRQTLEGRMVLSESMRYQLLAKCTRASGPMRTGRASGRPSCESHIASPAPRSPQVLEVEWDEAFPK